MDRHTIEYLVELGRELAHYQDTVKKGAAPEPGSAQAIKEAIRLLTGHYPEYRTAERFSEGGRKAWWLAAALDAEITYNDTHFAQLLCRLDELLPEGDP